MKSLGNHCTLYHLGPQRDLPPGETWMCTVCGCRIRTGCVHTAQEPWPHSTMATLIVDDYEGVNDWLN